jgi:hypothetical protein
MCFISASENAISKVDRVIESDVDILYKKLMGKVPQPGIF